MAQNLTQLSQVNNDVYETLGERWYSAEDDPIALLRAEEDPGQVIAEAARVLKPAGLFFFHTFNRNVLSWLIVIKGVAWFVRNTPPNLDILRLFLKPAEVRSACEKHGLVAIELQGMRPKLGLPFWKMLLTRSVPADFAFTFTKSTGLGFSGMARKPGAHGNA